MGALVKMEPALVAEGFCRFVLLLLYVRQADNLLKKGQSGFHHYDFADQHQIQVFLCSMTSEEYTFFKTDCEEATQGLWIYWVYCCSPIHLSPWSRQFTSLHGLQDTVPGGPNSKSILLYILKSLKQMYLTHQRVLSCASPMRTSSGLPAISVAFLSKSDHLASLQMGW